MTQKIFLTALALLLLVMIGAGYYFFIYAAPSKSNISLDPETNAPAPTESNTFPTNNPPTSASTSTPGTTDPTSTTTAPLPPLLPLPPLKSRFSQISAEPVADIISVGTGTTTVLYGEKNTGHIFEINRAGESVVRSNTTIPSLFQLIGGQVKSAPWLVLRYFKNNQLQNFLGSLATSTPEASSTVFSSAPTEGTSIPLKNSSFLPANISSLATSPDGSTLAYGQWDGQQTQIFTTDSGHKKTTALFTTPLQEFRLLWPSAGTIILVTNPSGTINGFAYSYDLKTKQLTRIINGVSGLEVLPSPDGKQLLYSGGGQNSLFLALYDLKNQRVTKLSLITMASLCTWSANSQSIYCAAPTNLPTGIYPDIWLRGEVSLKDKIWKIPVGNSSVQLVFDPALASPAQSLDISKLIVTSGNERLYILNKTDFSLWALDLGLGF